MKHGSLFSGIGGFDLAAEWMGWENVFHCEWNPFGQKILKHYWPKAESFDDITKTDFTKYANTIDILTGGFPCQPYSSAGQRKGKEDERHLWPHMLRAIQEISPRYIVGENVRGLLNWNGGMVFNEVCVDLENNGYQVAPVIIPACGVNAPHKRERIWFVAYREDSRHASAKTIDKWGKPIAQNGHEIRDSFDTNGIIRNVADTDGQRHRRRNYKSDANKSEEWQMGKHKKGNRDGVWGKIKGCGKFIARSGTWDKFPSQSPVCSGNDGIPTELDGIAISNWRKESVKAYGNAIVPQVAFEIFKAIQQCDDAML